MAGMHLWAQGLYMRAVETSQLRRMVDTLRCSLPYECSSWLMKKSMTAAYLLGGCCTAAGYCCIFTAYARGPQQSSLVVGPPASRESELEMASREAEEASLYMNQLVRCSGVQWYRGGLGVRVACWGGVCQACQTSSNMIWPALMHAGQRQ